jgi:hypothetical protein
MSRPYAVIGKVWKQFPTYAELKSRLAELIEQCPDKELTVFRSRRGEWGEWREVWGFNHQRKPVLREKGWM